MKPIQRFKAIAHKVKHLPGETAKKQHILYREMLELVVNNEPTGIFLEGGKIARQFEMFGNHLLFVTFNEPANFKALYIYYLSTGLDILDQLLLLDGGVFSEDQIFIDLDDLEQINDHQFKFTLGNQRADSYTAITYPDYKLLTVKQKPSYLLIFKAPWLLLAYQRIWARHYINVNSIAAQEFLTSLPTMPGLTPIDFLSVIKKERNSILYHVNDAAKTYKIKGSIILAQFRVKLGYLVLLREEAYANSLFIYYLSDSLGYLDSLRLYGQAIDTCVATIANQTQLKLQLAENDWLLTIELLPSFKALFTYSSSIKYAKKWTRHFLLLQRLDTGARQGTVGTKPPSIKETK